MTRGDSLVAAALAMVLFVRLADELQKALPAAVGPTKPAPGGGPVSRRTSPREEASPDRGGRVRN